MRRLLALALAALAPAAARAEEAKPAVVDRVVVRFSASEVGGPATPRYVFERELSFEARLEALSDPEPNTDRVFVARHVRAALERHVAETLLEALPITPEPTPKDIARRADLARAALEARAGGKEAIASAAAAEGITSGEVDAFFRRQARASFYLDRMVAPMLEPTEGELRDTLARGASPYAGRPYEEVARPLARWLLAERLKQALDAYLQAARVRVRLVVVGPS